MHKIGTRNCNAAKNPKTAALDEQTSALIRDCFNTWTKNFGVVGAESSNLVPSQPKSCSAYRGGWESVKLMHSLSILQRPSSGCAVGSDAHLPEIHQSAHQSHLWLRKAPVIPPLFVFACMFEAPLAIAYTNTLNFFIPSSIT